MRKDRAFVAVVMVLVFAFAFALDLATPSPARAADSSSSDNTSWCNVSTNYTDPLWIAAAWNCSSIVPGTEAYYSVAITLSDPDGHLVVPASTDVVGQMVYEIPLAARYTQYMFTIKDHFALPDQDGNLRDGSFQYVYSIHPWPLDTPTPPPPVRPQPTASQPVTPSPVPTDTPTPEPTPTDPPVPTASPTLTASPSATVSASAAPTAVVAAVESTANGHEGWGNAWFILLFVALFGAAGSLCAHLYRQRSARRRAERALAAAAAAELQP